MKTSSQTIFLIFNIIVAKCFFLIAGQIPLELVLMSIFPPYSPIMARIRYGSLPNTTPVNKIKTNNTNMTRCLPNPIRGEFFNPNRIPGTPGFIDISDVYKFPEAETILPETPAGKKEKEKTPPKERKPREPKKEAPAPKERKPREPKKKDPKPKEEKNKEPSPRKKKDKGLSPEQEDLKLETKPIETSRQAAKLSELDSLDLQLTKTPDLSSLLPQVEKKRKKSSSIKIESKNTGVVLTVKDGVAQISGFLN